MSVWDLRDYITKTYEMRRRMYKVLNKETIIPQVTDEIKTYMKRADECLSSGVRTYLMIFNNSNENKYVLMDRCYDILTGVNDNYLNVLDRLT